MLLQFLLSLFPRRQSNPSTLTAGLLPKLDLTQPPALPPPPAFLADEDGDGGITAGAGGVTLSSPKRESCINGLATLVGGDPQKKGGDDATCAPLFCSFP